jgi:hypothetical protein
MMTSFGRAAGGAGLLILAATVVATAPASASARHRVVRVPCAAAALSAAIASGDLTPVVLRPARNCTYLLTTALPLVTGEIVLLGGPSTTIKRAPATPDLRILDIAAGGRLRVRGITLQNGATTTAPGGGIRNAGALVLDHVTLTGNTASGNNGGGLANTGRALVVESVFAANATEGPVGNRDGGGIDNNGDLTVFASLMVGNVAAHDGGAIFTAAGHGTRVISPVRSRRR